MHALHYVHSASARPHGNRVEALACRRPAGRIDRKHRRVAWVRAVRWRCRPGLAVNMDQIGMYFNKVLISIVSLSGILTWTPHNDPFVAMYSQWLASGRPSGLLCVRLVWCGLYDGAAYLSTSESYLRDFGVVRLIPRAAYSPEITVHVKCDTREHTFVFIEHRHCSPTNGLPISSLRLCIVL